MHIDDVALPSKASRLLYGGLVLGHMLMLPNLALGTLVGVLGVINEKPKHKDIVAHACGLRLVAASK